MKEFVYEETKYIKRQDLKDFIDLMLQYEFMPEGIQDEAEYNRIFLYLANLTEKAPDFLQTYEFALSMLSQLEPTEELITLENDLEQRRIQACERVAEKEKIFGKTVEWAIHENRPLIRGLFSKANKLWKAGQIKEANELFTKIHNTNENDNVGARYSVKATGEGMTFEEFEKRFVIEDDRGSYYRTPELWDWYGEE